jgi:hypothetical protein
MHTPFYPTKQSLLLYERCPQLGFPTSRSKIQPLAVCIGQYMLLSVHVTSLVDQAEAGNEQRNSSSLSHLPDAK